jgi:large subunit ribosomal protein L4
MKIKILNLNDLGISERDLDVISENLLVNHDLIGSVVKWQLANRRGFSTAKTKTRGEIAMTGKKPRNQKHTGSARQGSMKSAQFVGGAKSFGPKPRDFSYTMPKKAVKKALSMVLKNKISEDKFYVINGLQKLPISTKELNNKFIKKEIVSPLIVYQEGADNFCKSVRNIKGVKLLNACALNVYDILNHDFLLLDEYAYEKVKNEVL